MTYDLDTSHLMTGVSTKNVLKQRRGKENGNEEGRGRRRWREGTLEELDGRKRTVPSW